MINRNLPLSYYREEFAKEGVVVIPAFLEIMIAETIYDNIANWPRFWWQSSSKTGDENITYIKNEASNQFLINSHKFKVRQGASQGLFSYSFLRTINDHFAECGCQECFFRKNIVSEESLHLINFITQRNLSSIETLFSSLYEPGDFLTAHQDTANGEVGFVYNLSKYWSPEFGGILSFVEEGSSKILRSIVPSFNTLVMFHLEKMQQTPHMVSQVSDFTPDFAKRLAITGWWKS